MPIPNTGAISLTSTFQGEFGGEVPTSMSEYYRGGLYVPNTALNTSIPTSGALTFTNFRNTSKATFSILPSSTNINEGDTVTFTVSTTDFGSGTLYWTLTTISGTIINNDFSSPSNVLSGGSVTVTNNAGTINLTLANDANTDGIDSFVLSLRVNSTSGTIVATSSTVTVADTSLTQTFSLSRSASSVNEGNSVTITLTTTNVPNGTTIPYTITGISSADLSSGSLTGNFTVNSNSATQVFTFNQESSASYLYLGKPSTTLGRVEVSRYTRTPLVSNIALEQTNTSLGSTTFSFTSGSGVENYDVHPQGTMLFIYRSGFGISRHNLSTSFDISAGSAGSTTSQNRNMNTPTTRILRAATISPDGLRYLVFNTSDQYLYSYSFLASTPYDVSTLATGWGQRLLIGTGSTLSYPDTRRPSGPLDMFCSPAGKFYLLSGGTIWQYSISSTSFAVSTIAYQKRFEITVWNTTPVAQSMAFTPDGSTLYVSRWNATTSSHELRQYSLSNPWEVDTLTLTNTRTTTETTWLRPRVGSFVEGNETMILTLDNGASSIAVTVVDVP